MNKHKNIFVSIAIILILGMHPIPAMAEPPSGMVSYWRFDDGSGTTASDSVGDNAGTLINGPTWTTGIVGGALSFDGLDDYVSVPHTASLDFVYQITMEAWIKPNGYATYSKLFYRVGGNTYELSVPNGQLWFYMIAGSGGSGIVYNLVSDNAIPTGVWSHVAATYNGSSMKLYIDAVLVKERSATGLISNTHSGDLLIGNANAAASNWAFNGLIDEVAIYGTALSPEQIQQHYENGLAGIGYIPINHAPSAPNTPEWDPSTPGEILHVNWQSIFISSATDPDADQVKIVFDWGDGNTDISELKPSGTIIPMDHSWSSTGMFEVKAKAIDANSAESGWSPSLEVTVVQDEKADVWSGYMVASLFPVVTISVEGEWTYPSYSGFPLPLFSAQATWIGIGGNGPTSNLLQAGIFLRERFGVPFALPFYMTIDNKGHAKEVDGWEYLFNQPSAGDIIETKITEVGNNQWQIYVTDETKGWSPWMPPIVTFQPDTTTAEWIHEPGANGSGIVSFNSVTFQQARLTVNGRTYEVGNINPSEVQSELFLCNMKRGTATVTRTSAITSYETFTIADTGQRPASSSPITSFSLHSNATLSVFDSLSNHDGYNSTSGLVDMQIPNSLYFEDQDGAQCITLCQPDSYRVDVVGTSDGDFHLHEQVSDNDIVALDQWVNETISINETKTYYLVHEIGVESLASHKSIIGTGYSDFINVGVYNQGNYTETFNVTAYANATAIGTQLVTLTNGNSTILTFTWNTAGFAKGNYTISAYAEPVPGETDTADNNCTGGTVTVAIAGDVTGEGLCDMQDISILIDWFMAKSPNWNPNCDVNGDLSIDMADISIAIDNFMQS